MVKNSYETLAACLALTGACLGALAFLILNSTPITALGISTVIIGGVCYAVSRGQPKISQEASTILIQSGAENTSALIEELGLKSKAIYLPSSISGDKPKALIPMAPEAEFNSALLPKRLIVKYGAEPNAMGLLVVTPGSAVGGVVEPKPESSAGDIESALSSILLGTVNLADGVLVQQDSGRIIVAVTGVRLESQKMWVYESLGTPIASIVASTVAEILDKPIQIENEISSRSKCIINLKMVGRPL